MPAPQPSVSSLYTQIPAPKPAAQSSSTPNYSALISEAFNAYKSATSAPIPKPPAPAPATPVDPAPVAPVASAPTSAPESFVAPPMQESAAPPLRPIGAGWENRAGPGSLAAGLGQRLQPPSMSALSARAGGRIY